MRELFKSIQIIESSAELFSFRKPVNANPGLKVNGEVTCDDFFLVQKCFLLLMFYVVWDYSNGKLKDKQNNDKTFRKVTKLESKFSLILG